MRRSPTWASMMRGQLAEMAELDIPYMLDKLADMQEFIDHTRAKLQDMQRRQAAIKQHLEGLEET